MKKTITINILNFSFIPNERYYNLFHLREDHTGILLNDDIEIHFLELPKLQEQRASLSDRLVKWSLFLKGVDKPELWEVIAMNEPALQKAMDTLEFLSQNEEARRLYEMRQKALHDEASMIDGEKEEGRREREVEVAKNLLDMGIDIAKIAKATGLSEDEVQKLKDEMIH